MEDNTVHKTVTGKEFILTDLEGNPLNYNDYKGSFTRQHLAMLEVGQILKSSSLGDHVKTHKITK